MSAPARMEKMIAMSKQHTAPVEARLGALNTRGGGGHGHHGGAHMKHGMTQ